MRKVTVYLPDEFDEHLRESRAAIRADGHHPPSMSALIGAFAYRAWLESSDGSDTEDRIMVSYRREFEDVR